MINHVSCIIRVPPIFVFYFRLFPSWVMASMSVHVCYWFFLPPAALNLSVFLLIGRSSALTMNVAGVIKDWLLIGLSVMLYK